MADVLPCPFCGSRALIDNEKGLWTLGCFKEDCADAFFHADSREAVIEAWNTRALISPAGEVSGWQPIDTAPKDGTLILTWCVHVNAEFCDDAVAEGYAGPVIAKWIDHNGGGFTWHGLAGTHTHWMPLPAAPRGMEG